jgi:hypothetical protein
MRTGVYELFVAQHQCRIYSARAPCREQARSKSDGKQKARTDRKGERVARRDSIKK